MGPCARAMGPNACADGYDATIRNQTANIIFRTAKRNHATLPEVLESNRIEVATWVGQKKNHK
jgi:hypothetical protein